MTEHNPYLHRIFGPDALQVATQLETHVITGEYDFQTPIPSLGDVTREGDALSFTVTQEHTAGHFTGPKTLPAYRMLEAMGLGIQEHDMGIGAALNATFTAITIPGDTLTAQKEDSRYTLMRGTKEIARARYILLPEGLTPVHIGVMLELAAQTVVANMAPQKDMNAHLFYPLILSVGSVVVFAPLPDRVHIMPHSMTQIDKANNFKASANILDRDMKLVVEVSDIAFRFATAGTINLYNSLGRTSVTASE